MGLGQLGGSSSHPHGMAKPFGVQLPSKLGNDAAHFRRQIKPLLIDVLYHPATGIRLNGQAFHHLLTDLGGGNRRPPGLQKGDPCTISFTKPLGCFFDALAIGPPRYQEMEAF